jgi:hypothetical protein
LFEWLKSMLEQRSIRNVEVDVNAKCPACGHRDGKLKCVIVEAKDDANRTAMIEHTCQVCDAKFYEPTIVKPENWVASEVLAAEAKEG